MGQGAWCITVRVSEHALAHTASCPMPFAPYNKTLLGAQYAHSNLAHLGSTHFDMVKYIPDVIINSKQVSSLRAASFVARQSPAERFQRNCRWVHLAEDCFGKNRRAKFCALNYSPPW